ncbi:exopolysaccharide biosynthesis protein [Roseomonas sp. WA12]
MCDRRHPSFADRSGGEPADLRNLGDRALHVPPERVTLEWLLRGLGDWSFGVLLLLMAFLGALPGLSVAVGLLVLIRAYQMLRARSGPAFPRVSGAHPLPLARLVGSVVPVLRLLEQVRLVSSPTLDILLPGLFLRSGLSLSFRTAASNSRDVACGKAASTLTGASYVGPRPNAAC